MNGLANALAFGRLVKLSHTVFGLPFCIAALALAHSFSVQAGEVGVDALKIVLIVLAFTSARAAALGFNRIIDRRFDAANPRTAEREIPTGVVSVRSATLMTVVSGFVFVAASAGLGPWPAMLALPCLGVVLGYSYCKRFTWGSHLVLGLALSLAPGGAWVAVTGGFEGFAVPGLLMVAVATWVAGFDVLYALGDVEFDRDSGLHSIPARFGVRGALVLSGLLHIGTAAALGALHLQAGLGTLHLVGVCVVVAILVVEHAIVRPGDLSKLGRAFFELNGYVSLTYLAFVLADLLV